MNDELVIVSRENAALAAVALCDGESPLLPSYVSDVEVQELMTLFQIMMKRPDVLAGLWTYDYVSHEKVIRSLPPSQAEATLVDADIGFVLRDGSKNKDDGTDFDIKLYFHYRPVLHQLLVRPGVVLDRTAQRFLALARSFYWRNYALGLKVAQAHPTDEVLGSLYSQSDEHVFRILAYLKERKDGSGLIAAPHRDKSLFTLAIATSHPGFEMADDEDSPFLPAETPPGMIRLFRGGKWETRYRDQKANPHQVRILDLPQFSPEIIRWSMVHFAHGNFPFRGSTKMKPK